MPTLLRTVVCPVDFSAASAEALTYAVSLAREAEAHLTVVHVVDSLPDEPPELARYNVKEYRRILAEGARKRLESLLPAHIRASLRPEILVTSGKAYQQILKIAEERSAGVIVMGVHGRTPLDVFIFGSTAAQLVHNARCPVMTVRPSLMAAEAVAKEVAEAAASVPAVPGV